MTAKQVFRCNHCGVSVLQYPSQVGKTFHCSRACYTETQRLLVPHNKGKVAHISKACAVCGKLMSGMPSEVKRRKFCSVECTASAFRNDAETALSRYREVDGCWLWEGALRGGYGRVKLDGRTQAAHRASYELHVGPIPSGLVLDHLCRNRSCVNPAHLEPVTTEENIRRGEQGSPEAMRKHWATRRGVPSVSDSGNGGREPR